MFKNPKYSDWTTYRELFDDFFEVDFHYSEYGEREVSYQQAMADVRKKAFSALKRAKKEAFKFVFFIHGHSTSNRGETTSRSVVRSLMRSKQATPYIKRSECIQHRTIFIAAIKESEDSEEIRKKRYKNISKKINSLYNEIQSIQKKYKPAKLHKNYEIRFERQKKDAKSYVSKKKFITKLQEMLKSNESRYRIGKNDSNHRIRLYFNLFKDDNGFCPNPFWGYCTLAACNPFLRLKIKKNDWLLGILFKENVKRKKITDSYYIYKIAYLMKIDEILNYNQYFIDERFQRKIPDLSKNEFVNKCGDNIFRPLSKDKFEQLPSIKTKDFKEKKIINISDLKCTKVLISKNFYYFGSKHIKFPLAIGSPKTKFVNESNVDFLLESFSDYNPGVIAPPTSWPNDDDSWKSNEDSSLQ